MMKRCRRYAMLLCTAGLVACGGPALGAISSPTPQAGSAGTRTITPARLWVQQDGEPGAGSIALVDTALQRTTVHLPAGVIGHDWRRLYTVGPTAAGTTLVAVDPTSGRTVDTAAVPTGFDVPSFGPGIRPTGLSPNAQHLVLVSSRPAVNAQPSTSSFLVVDTAALSHAPRRVNLTGSFHYDGVSNDGQNLYLLEDLAPESSSGGYHVRRYDLAAGALDPRVIADKRSGERTMSGWPIDQATSLDGAWQFTVYAFGSSSPFVHVLNLDTSVSFCIDLPAAVRDQELDALWGVAASHDGRFVYAVNAASGSVVEMPVDSAYQTRSGSLPVPSPSAAAAGWAPFAPLVAQAKRISYGGAAISPDNHTLYSIGTNGVSVIDAATLQLRTSWVTTLPLVSLLLGPDGRLLYAVTADGSVPLVQIDARSGGWVGITGASQPVAVLRVGA